MVCASMLLAIRLAAYHFLFTFTTQAPTKKTLVLAMTQNESLAPGPM